MSANRIITGNDVGLINQLQNAGILPSGCKRVVIDVEYNNIVTLYYEVHGDARLCDIDFAAGINIHKAAPRADQLLKETQESEDAKK